MINSYQTTTKTLETLYSKRTLRFNNSLQLLANSTILLLFL